jgi:hypothetical protein
MVTSHHHHALKILSHVTYTLNCITCTNPRPLQPGPPCQLAWTHLTHQCQALRDQKKGLNNPRTCHAGHPSHPHVTPLSLHLSSAQPCPGEPSPHPASAGASPGPGEDYTRRAVTCSPRPDAPARARPRSRARQYACSPRRLILPLDPSFHPLARQDPC